MKFVHGVRADEIVALTGGHGEEPLKVHLRNGETFTFGLTVKYDEFVKKLERVLAEGSAQQDTVIPYDLIRVVDSLRTEVKKLKCEIRKENKEEEGK